MIFFGMDHLRRALQEYVAHYSEDRPHQGLGNELVAGTDLVIGAGKVTQERTARWAAQQLPPGGPDREARGGREQPLACAGEAPCGRAAGCRPDPRAAICFQAPV